MEKNLENSKKKKKSLPGIGLLIIPFVSGKKYFLHRRNSKRFSATRVLYNVYSSYKYTLFVYLKRPNNYPKRVTNVRDASSLNIQTY